MAQPKNARVAWQKVGPEGYGLHYCPIYQQRVAEELCLEQTRILSTNWRVCARIRCKSPWRRCVKCLEQGFLGQGAEVVNAETGLCAFHTEHGVGSDRKNYKRGGPPQPVQAVQLSRRDLVAASAQRVASATQQPGSELVPPSLTARPDPVAAEGEVLIDRSLIHPNPRQPRKYFDPVLMRQLALSIAEVGQLDPIAVVAHPEIPGHWKILDGERRYRACGTAGVNKMRAVIKVVADEKQLFRDAAVRNFGRAPHTHLEIAYAIRKVMRDSNQTHIVKLARMFAQPVIWVYQHLSLLKLHPDVQAMMDPEVPEKQRLNYSIALQLAGLSQQLQAELARRIIQDGMRLNQARFFIRQKAAEAGERSGIGRKGRKPVDDFRILRTYLGRVNEGAKQFLVIAAERFPEMFKHRDLEDLTSIIKQVEEDLDNLSRLLEALQATKKQKEADLLD